MSTDVIAPDDVGAAFREAMAHVCAPVVVVTAFDGQRPHGTTVSAFMSLSMGPPMIAVALDRASAVLELIRMGQRFAINVLAAAHSDLALNFARKGDDKFERVAWHSRSELPALDGAGGWVACEAASFVDGGDHTMVFGVVIDAAHEALAPLTYHKRSFGTHKEWA